MGVAASLDGHSIGADFGHPSGWNMYHGKEMPGFPKHPHRGFETITVTRQGWIDHTDSLGNSGRFGGGDVQWMTAGRGISHSEMFPMLNQDGENVLELFQIWINLPKRTKMAEPSFKMLWHETLPSASSSSGGGSPNVEVTLVAGMLPGVAAPPSPPPDSYLFTAVFTHTYGPAVTDETGQSVGVIKTYSTDTKGWAFAGAPGTGQGKVLVYETKSGNYAEYSESGVKKQLTCDYAGYATTKGGAACKTNGKFGAALAAGLDGDTKKALLGSCGCAG
jgi:hypothetical protein